MHIDEEITCCLYDFRFGNDDCRAELLPSADASSVCTLSLIDKTCNGVINQISFWICNVTNVALLFKNRKNQESVENYRYSI